MTSADEGLAEAMNKQSVGVGLNDTDACPLRGKAHSEITTRVHCQTEILAGLYAHRACLFSCTQADPSRTAR